MFVLWFYALVLLCLLCLAWRSRWKLPEMTGSELLFRPNRAAKLYSNGSNKRCKSNILVILVPGTYKRGGQDTFISRYL